MKTTFSKIALLISASLATTSGLFAADFQIHDGDRVVFLGDSITEQRLYTTYIEAYTLTRHPDWNLHFRNVGWGGDTAWLRQRSHPDEKTLFAAGEAEQQKMVFQSVYRGLERDVLPLKPTFVTIKFGMNDHSYQAFREDIFKAYVRSQEELGKVLEANGARVAYLTPQPIEDKRPDPDKDIKNLSLRKFSDGLHTVAGKVHGTFVDQFDPYMAIMMKARTINPEAVIGGGDSVHPGPIGHTVMAWAVLKGLGASALVSSADLNAAAKKLNAAENCQIENLSFADGSVSFDRLDQALPMPIDPKAAEALKLAPITDELNRYEIKITGLPEGRYEISVDGDILGHVTGEALAKGHNLGANLGPITAQSQQVLKLVFDKNNQFFNRWRNVQLANLPGWAQGPELEVKRAAEVARLDQEIGVVEKQIDSLRKPKKHHFVIKHQ